jgi:hypothetical protein
MGARFRKYIVVEQPHVMKLCVPCSRKMAPVSSKVRKPPSNADLSSNMSSEFEEVHLEEAEQSTSTGSGEEVEWTQSGTARLGC